MPADKKASKLHSVLKDTFGFDEFRDGQQAVIENILDGISSLCVFPTGRGKSLCYQLPAVLLNRKTSIVVSPLLSLMRDQMLHLEELGISSATLNSGQLPEEREETIEKLQNKKITLLFLSPESLLKKDYQTLFKSLDLGIIAIDEAHCVSEWGNSFRPSYLLAANAVRKLKPTAVLALTATATKDAIRDIRSRFKIKTKDLFQTPIYRENLHYQIIPTSKELRSSELVKILEKPESLPAIVYVMKQIDAESVCANLQANNIKARAYHAGMSPEARRSVQDAFVDGELHIVVATIAFGMGINKADIRSVIHYHLPKSPEGWVQETGRAGRDGKVSNCYLLGCGDDLVPLTNLILGNEVSKNAVTRIVEAIFSQGKDITVSKYHLCQLNDTNESQLEIIFSFLISEGYITPNENSWKFYQVSRLRYTTHEYGRSKQNIVNAINDHWGRIDSTTADDVFGISRSRLINIIEEMRDLGDVAVKTTGKLTHFILKTQPTSSDAIIDSLVKNFTLHKEAAVKRLDAVISTATTRSCIPARMVKYFGESLEAPCGNCSSCSGEKRQRKLPSSPIPAITLEQAKLVSEVYNSNQSVLSTSTRLSRFCCGISSPAIRHARLYSDENFGFLSNIPYGEVYAQCKAVIGN